MAGQKWSSFLPYEKNFRRQKFRGPRGRSRAFVCCLSSQVLGLHSVGRLTSEQFLLCGPRHRRFPPASEGHPPRLIPHSGGIDWCPGAPKRGMPTGPKVFLALPDACGLRPCDRTHLKNGLVPYSCVGGTQR